MRRQHLRSILPLGLLAALAGAWLVACGGVRPVWEELAPVSRPVVDRTDATVLRVRWPASYTLSAVKVFAGTSPEAINHDEPVARTYGLDTSVNVRGLDPFQRYYLELQPDLGARPRIVAERRLPLEGTDNFRDIGGYETTDGYAVRWGLLYRSNNLADLSNDDLRYLARLHVQLVCDFRSEPERTQAPNRQPGDEAETAELTIAVEGVDPRQMQERIRTGVSGDQLEQIMLNAYRSFVTDHSDQWKAMFERIGDRANLPTIVHCTAGKDRTGFASAMILLALGVPEKTVFEDYMSTNRYRAGYNKWISRLIPIYSLFRTRGQDMEALLEARRPYLQASLDAIEEGYGSVDAYLEQALGVTSEDRSHLRDIFLRRL
jgi:protein-tyrosine phosphatase